jgi:hypothetical protein
MPYSNATTLWNTDGGDPTSPVSARLWQIWSTVGGPGAGWNQQEEGRDDIQVDASGQTPQTFSFALGPDFQSVSRSIGLSIQDTPGVASDRGWLFRSGSFDTLPTEQIEVVAARTLINQTDLDAMLPAVPMVVDTSTTITAITAMIASGGIDFTATGTSTQLPAPVTFNFTGTMQLFPSANVALVDEVLDVGFTGANITFMGTGNVASAIEAALLNAVNGVILTKVLPIIRDTLQSRINGSIASSAGRSLPGGTLPTGVVLSVRSVRINGPGAPTPDQPAATIGVRGALGAFGGVLSKLPPPPSGGGTSLCAGSTLAALGQLAVSLDALRLDRDALALSPAGARLVELYYRWSPDVAGLLVQDSALSARLGALAEELHAALREPAAHPEAMRRLERVLVELAERLPSPARTDMKDALALLGRIA